VIDYVSDFFQKSINERIDVGFKKSKNITGRIYFHFDSRFEWPSLNLPPKTEHGFCYGLSSHIGIHADGTLVPCCLDKEANISLGNVLKTRLVDLLESEEAQKIRIGFTQKKLIHPLCQSCDFIQRFN
jgi:radical SAM protein with 4Fe4S-binding SPASM domain